MLWLIHAFNAMTASSEQAERTAPAHHSVVQRGRGSFPVQTSSLHHTHATMNQIVQRATRRPWPGRMCNCATATNKSWKGVAGAHMPDMLSSGNELKAMSTRSQVAGEPSA
jgi:hypothetical protein